MSTLTADSSITIDGFTITAPAPVIMLWERVIAAAGSRGETIWIRTEDGSEVKSVLVRPSSAVISTLARPEQSGDLSLDKATNSNLAALVDRYIKPNIGAWDLAKALGIDAEIRANHATESTAEDA
ncbi:hypothetical protein [Microbacterium sp. MYb62]|uniref:hypothetical protein n=1 Tax=Microbacterium sp. MYb62 TaxID=1848690 RepID=UPI000CFD1BAB|nr:hypothetical protein [Microbacterium sp. MYb62]PRB14497.1 hypothetical protein CQ042_11305 [Microbacterium sp. MYb62]